MTPRDIDNALTLAQTRRHFFRDCGVGVGSMALASLLARDAGAAPERKDPLAPRKPHHKPKAKAVIYLFMAGAPSQLELFEPKPKLNELSGQKVPESFTQGKRFAFIKGDAKLLGSVRKFAKAGNCGMDVSELLPYHREIADDVCWLRGMKTDVFNHGPAKCFVNTGSPQFGRPSMGAWLTYGLGSESDSLPGFVVLQSGPRGPRGGAALYSSGFLPSVYQGVPFLKGPNPILDLSPPPGVDRKAQGEFVDAVKDLNGLRHGAVGDPEIQTRIAAYEMAYRMQSSAPELMDLAKEDKKTLDLYGAAAGKPSFAANCLLARRLVQRGVRFVQLYHTDWDHHGGSLDLTKPLDNICKEIDQPCAALVKDLKRLGLLDSTIVVWGGEFGRTPMGEPRETIGRDHHIDAYTMWVAGGGFKPGRLHGTTDEIGYNVTENAVHVHDLQATLLHQMGLDHTKLTFRFQGRDYRLTDVHGHVVKDVLA
ncbi:MAG: sulfatase [Isosphaera sp.]|nr:sulfatase [Isosphaera sp.]